MRTLPRFTLLTLLAIGLAACGDDSDTSSSTSGTSTTSTGGEGGRGDGGSGPGGGAGTGGEGQGGEGGSGVTAPTATMSPVDVLGLHEAVVVTFDEAMDPASLVLGGSLAAWSDGGVWSTELAENDTLTISPDGSWESGNQTLTVTASDLAGSSADASGVFTIRFILEDFQAASVVIGQPDFTSAAANQGGAVSASGFGEVWGDAGYDRASGTLFLADYDNHRVLGFAGVPADNGAAAAFVLGQSAFDTFDSGVSASAMQGPETVTFTGGKLVLNDWLASRVTIYDPVPTRGRAPRSWPSVSPISTPPPWPARPTACNTRTGTTRRATASSSSPTRTTTACSSGPRCPRRAARRRTSCWGRGRSRPACRTTTIRTARPTRPPRRERSSTPPGCGATVRSSS
jgi:hypothetical protein